jgi:hypothetical protein
MPIRPENRDRYPADWKDISFRIRFARALGRCECTGQCGTTHATTDDRCEARHNGPHPRTGSKVVLTVAHLDHTPENSDDANLLAMCPACHLAYDLDEHKATAARTKAAEIATWNTPLPGLEPAPEPVHAPLLAREFTSRLDAVAFASTMPVPPTRDEERELAACYVASRARALDWTREQHETTLLALFQPPRSAADWENSSLPRLA